MALCLSAPLEAKSMEALDLIPPPCQRQATCFKLDRFALTLERLHDRD